MSRRFGEVRAVERLDLAVREGEIVGLIGHNGAGKTTLIRMMLGLLAPDEGQIRIAGEPVRGPGFREVRRRLAYLPENLVLYDNLTGLETLEFVADLKGLRRAACGELLGRVGLARAARRAVRGYSKGMRQRLGFAQALLGDPRLLFLDEPTSGLDPEAIGEFYDILRELRANGVTALLSSHQLAEIEARVDRIAVMRTGRLIAVGTVAELRDQLALPVRMELRLVPGAAARVEVALDGLPHAALRLDGERAWVDCPGAAKLPVLHVLTGLGGEVIELHVREPSLEDVFLGYREN